MQRCHEIRQACGAAIAWVETNRGRSSRLDQESTALTLHLRRARNRAKALGWTADRPFAVGFFGLSQAGKSYLISALAAGATGRLDIAVGGERLNFLTHINPPGGGKEATGLVTRLTQRPAPAATGFPVRLHLLSLGELVKVLGNSFFKDFDRERVPFDIDACKVREQLAALEKRRQAQPVAGMDADDLIDIQDYFEKRFPHSTAPLKADYWPSARSLIADLGTAERAELCSLLWGGVPELTATFQRLADGLSTLGYAPTVDCEIAALVAPQGSGGWTPTGSIVDVDVLDRLGKDTADTLRVLPQGTAAAAAPVAIPRSVLAALTAEIELTLADPPATRLAGEVDLLDFPGYRGRLAIGDLADVSRQLHDERLDPVAQLVLRGKVAYLFERYTEAQAMNALVLCTPANQQSDVSDLGEVIADWIATTQGPDPGTRSSQPCGLVWALTKFDQRLDVVPGQTVDTLRNFWDGMVKLALVEHFGKYPWLHEWAPQRPFANVFPVRKPGKAGAVIRTDGEREFERLPAQAERVGLLRQTFCENLLVRKHILKPEAAWDAVLQPNDGGVSRLLEHLGLAVDHEGRRGRLSEQIDALAADLAERWLMRYYRAEDPADATAKQTLARGILTPLGKRLNRVGDLIALLQPSRDALRALYLRADLDEDVPAEPAIDIDAIIFGATATAATPTARSADRAARFAREAMRLWIQQIRGLVDEARIGDWFGIPQTNFADLIDELVTGADRLGLEGRIAVALRPNENLPGILREQLAARQADAVYFALCGFIDCLEDFAPPDETGAPGQPHPATRFVPPPLIEAGAVPDLPTQPEPFTERYVTDWFRALVALAVNNSGQAQGQEIPVEQQRALGAILAVLAPGRPPLTAA